MLTVRAQCLRELLAVGFVAAFASQVWAEGECCGKKKDAANAVAEQSAVAATDKAVARTFALKGLTEANGASIKEALAEYASAVALNPAAGTADVTWKAGQAVQISKIQKALEGAGASIDEDRWTLV